MKWQPVHATEEDASLDTFRNAINKKLKIHINIYINVNDQDYWSTNNSNCVITFQNS
jgi:hypothetical protein